MRNATILAAMSLAVLFMLPGSASAQVVTSDFTWGAAPSADGPFSTGHSGSRQVAGPFDLDGDGQLEVLIADYSLGGRVHVFENKGPDTWEWIFSTPSLEDSTNTTGNIRTFTAGDLDGDGFGEIIIPSGSGFTDDNALAGIGLFFFEATGDDTFSTTPVKYDFDGEPLDRWRAEQMGAMDVDGDGFDELYFGNNGGANSSDVWMVIGVTGDIGSGFETFVQEAKLSSRATESFDPVGRGGGSPYGMVPGDLDGDGNMDFAMMSWNSFNFTNMSVTGPDTYAIPADGAANINLQASAGVGDHVAFFGCFGFDMNADGDTEVYCPNLQTGAVSVLNYESGESALEVTADNVSFNAIPGLSSLGLTVGDLDQDGNPDLIAGGPSYTPGQFEQGQAPAWLRVSEFVGGDVEDPANYTTPIDLRVGEAMDVFNVITRDSAGVVTEFRENGAQGPEFVSKLAFLGDADGDGWNEVAVSMQGVDDSLFTINRTFNPADSSETDVVVSARANERVFLRILTSDGVNVAIEDTEVVLPSDYVLEQSYPNPFRGSTSIRFTLPIQKAVSVNVYDSQGRVVRSLVSNDVRAKGSHEVYWDGTTDAGAMAASGTYFYTLEYGNFRQSKSVVLVK